MGGHTKQSQRTKNNTKPSSSGRSAELLETSVGFGALSAAGGFAPSSSGFTALSDTTYDTINSNYQVVFKKMSKKDPTTKVKALQEFSDLISNSEIEDVKLVLPFWTKIYATLAVDSEHKVREKVQQVHHVLTQKAGKNLAPHIKQLAPIWLASQYDTYAPTASIAATSFKSSFSEQKIKEVFAYCQSDILEYVTKNLFSPAASNLKSQQTTGDLDKNVQVVTGCLKLYGLYIENTLQETIEQNLEHNESLLLNSKFWDFAQQKIGCVRSAWFETLFYLLKKAEFLINKYKQRVIPLVFSHLDDKDSTVLPHVWNCILLVQVLYKDWNSMIDFKKAIQPKLFSLIKSGANSNAADIYPSFLPFISNLNVDDEFYVDFFNALKNWIVQNCKHNYCKGNVAAALTAFYECLRFVTHTKNTTINQEWNYNSFMDDFVIDVIRLYFRNECIGHKTAFSNIAKLIANWTENKNDSKLYSDLLERFWSQLFTLFKDLEEIENNEYQLTRIVDFMQSFNNLETKKEKVKFSDNSDDPSKTTERKKAEKLILQNDLKKLAIKLAKFYTEKNTTQPSENYSNNINFLCRMFGDIEFYKTLNDGYLQTSFDTFYKFLTSEEKPHEVMVDTIFEVIKLMPEENRAECINKLLKLPNPLVHQWILERMLSYPLCLEKSVKETLNQTNVTDMILKLTKESLIENSSRKYNLIKMCFFQNNSGEILINKATVSGIIKVVADILEDKKDEPGEELLDKWGNFLSQVMSVLSSNNDYQDIKSEIFIKLFKISVNAMNDISDDTFWEVTTCWQDGIAAEDVTFSKDLLMECSRIVHSKLFIDDEFILTDIEKVANMVAKLVANLEEQNSSGLEVLKTFSDFNEPEMSNIWNTIQKFYCFMKCLEGESALGDIKDTIEDFSTYDVECLLKMNFFNFALNMQLLFSETESVGSSNDITECILEGLLKAMQICGSFSCIAETYSNMLSEKGQYILTSLGEKIQLRLSSLSKELSTSLILKSFACINENGSSGTSLLNYLPHIAKYSKTGDGLKSIFKDLTKYLCDRNNYIAFVNVLQALFDKLPPRSLSEHLEIFSDNENDLIKMAGIRSIVMNNHLADFNFLTDGKLVSLCLNIIKNFASKHDKKNNFLLYNFNISTSSVDDVKKIVEFINFLRVILTAYGSNLSVGDWDIIRVALSSWVLTVSNSLNDINSTKVLLFTSSVYKLFSALSKFIVQEKTKSSTELLSSIVDEWENCFALEVNLVLFKIYYNLVSLRDESLGVVSVINSISPSIEDLDFRLISTSCQKGFKLKLNDILEFSIKNLSSNLYSIRTTALIVIRKIATTLVSTDAEALRKRNEIEEQKNCNIENNDEWHHMYKFGSYLSDYAERIEEYSKAFSYKLTELADLEKVPSSVSMPLLYTWDCIIHICSLSSAEVRSIYAFWIGKNDFEQTILHFLFRIMPVEILKNHDSKIMNTDIFKPLEWNQILDRNISTERYACHLYGQMLRHFPALVRKWWNDCYPRQKTFVDKLTTNFVSNLICQEELRSITAKREKHENMQITVHSSTREVTATYSVDEARMELVISLAPNHPLGAVKVESGKHIGGRIQSRQVVMQLTIFLTHQNGSIFDGLTLWKNNLDKKFAGVEECYVCYSVIHQDTCQLPKLSCKTCKKKFHGPCLYKWFTTSSKSTCPICRNVF